MKRDARISVVTCLWNSMFYWETFYESLKRTATRIDELVVVDNGSEDGASGVIPRKYPDVRFIRLERNLFEGGGVARAMEAASGDLIFKCDPDIEFMDNTWQESMIELLELPEVGAVVTEPYHWPRVKDPAGFEEASVLVGTLFLLPRQTMNRCGLWDPGLKYGTNEFDYALRMRRAGLKIAIAPISPITHFSHHVRMREIGAFDVGPLIEESWEAFSRKIGGGDYWQLEENRRFRTCSP